MSYLRRSCTFGTKAAPWIATAALVFATLPSQADVSYAPKSGNTVPRITVSGEIKTDDLKHFITFARLARDEGLYQVRLDSVGGDIQTALSIGKIIRLDKAAVAVLRDSQCLSSCVFVLAGGAMRYVAGRVGIHRPFAPVDTRTTAVSQKQNYDEIEKEVKAYLRAMNIPVDLFDHMIRIPPERVKVLSVDELQRYGLSEDDPYEDAARVAGIAKSMGITAEELIRRQAKANADCASQNTDDSAECYTRILKYGR